MQDLKKMVILEGVRVFFDKVTVVILTNLFCDQVALF